MQDSYLQNIVLPYFKSYVNATVNIVLFDLNLNIIESSKTTAKSLGLTYEEIIGMNFHAITSSLIKRICYVKDKRHLQQITSTFEKIEKLLNTVIQERRTISYIDFIPYKNCFYIETVTNIPIFDDKSNVVAIQSSSSKYYLFDAINYLNSEEENNFLSTFNFTKEELSISKRQHEIIFLLSHGLNQLTISNFLGINRSTVSKTIERLCTKFDLEGINIEKLLDQARKLRLHEYIPNNFIRPKIVVLDERFSFQGNTFSI